MPLPTLHTAFTSASMPVAHSMPLLPRKQLMGGHRSPALLQVLNSLGGCQCIGRSRQGRIKLQVADRHLACTRLAAPCPPTMLCRSQLDVGAMESNLGDGEEDDDASVTTIGSGVSGVCNLHYCSPWP